MEFRAQARFMRTSPQKAKLVLDLIKGNRVEQALTTLAFTNKGVAPAVSKLLRSAIENANYASQEKGLDVDIDNLYVKTAVANEGPRMKRIRPAPMGRAFRYQRRMAHLEIVLAERNQVSHDDLVETVGEEGVAPAKGKTAGAKKSAGKGRAGKTKGKAAGKTSGMKSSAKKGTKNASRKAAK